MRIFYTFFFTVLFAANVYADIVEIHLEETNNSTIFKFSLDSNKGLIKRNINFIPVLKIKPISLYTIKDDYLYHKAKKITSAEKIIFQGAIGKKQIVIIINKDHSISSPKKLIRAVAGHPVPYAEIEVLIVRNGKKLEKDRLLKQESYGTWSATVWTNSEKNE